MLTNYYLSLDMEDMRECAIENHWFTKGNNEQYDKWLNMAGWRHKVTPVWLHKVATMAVNHSDLEMLGYANDDKESIVDNFTALLLKWVTIRYKKEF